jgi:23S rRNA (guanosine2251-2'-O)-methyltransferase
MQPVREAIRAHRRNLGGVLVEQAHGPSAGRLDAVARFAEDNGANVERVPRRTLDSMAQGAVHQGVVAWAPPLALHPPSELLASPSGLVVALDGIQDPQNFGAIVRSAVGFGATGIVWGEHSSAPLTTATFRASAGAIEHARLCRVSSLVRFLDDAVSAGCTVVGLASDAPAELHDLDLRKPTILVVGSEHEGLGRGVRSRCTTLARLALQGPVESLNASAACAAALYMAAVQRVKTLT